MILQINFRGNLDGRGRDVSYRNIEADKFITSEINRYKATVRGTKKIVKTLFKSKYKEVYRNTKFTFKYYKKKNRLIGYYETSMQGLASQILSEIQAALKNREFYVSRLPEVTEILLEIIPVEFKPASEMPKRGRRKAGEPTTPDDDEPEEDKDEPDEDNDEPEEEDDEPKSKSKSPKPTPHFTYNKQVRVLSPASLENLYGPEWMDMTDWDMDMEASGVVGSMIPDQQLNKLYEGDTIEMLGFLINLRMTNHYFVHKYQDLSDSQLLILHDALYILAMEDGDEEARREMMGLEMAQKHR